MNYGQLLFDNYHGFELRKKLPRDNNLLLNFYRNETCLNYFYNHSFNVVREIPEIKQLSVLSLMNDFDMVHLLDDTKLSKVKVLSNSQVQEIKGLITEEVNLIKKHLNEHNAKLNNMINEYRKQKRKWKVKAKKTQEQIKPLRVVEKLIEEPIDRNHELIIEQNNIDDELDRLDLAISTFKTEIRQNENQFNNMQNTLLLCYKKIDIHNNNN